MRVRMCACVKVRQGNTLLNRFKGGNQVDGFCGFIRQHKDKQKLQKIFLKKKTFCFLHNKKNKNNLTRPITE